MATWPVALIGLGSAAIAVLVTELWHAYRRYRRVQHTTATASTAAA
jgi:hypothetical protein